MEAAPLTSTTLGALLGATAAEHPERVAVRLDADELTYAELARRVRQFSAVLREQGVEPGDRVAVVLPNVPAFVVAYYAVLHAGGVVIAMNPLLKEREITHQLADSGAELIVASVLRPDAAEAGARNTGATCLITADLGLADLCDGPGIAEPVPRDGSDIAVMGYTAATTGKPKAAVLTHDNLIGNAGAMRDACRLTVDSVVLGALPLFHAFGQTCALNAVVAAGACVSLIPRFDPEHVLGVIARDGVTVIHAVPTMYVALEQTAATVEHDVSSLKLWISGGAKLRVELLERVEARFGCELREGYGLTETSPVVSFNHPDRPHKPGTVGPAIAGVTLRISASGEILVRGPNVMQRYWGQPEATAAVLDDGWLATGDLGELDEDGFLTITGRCKDLIIRAGYNVYPAEVELVLREHPAVRDCRVVGVPNDDLGEEVGAAVILEDGAEITLREVRAFVRAEIATYKCPSQIWFVDELPD
ncbi:MAG: long-chain acyl-CoA synthetase [Solirubrobacteraceae bacterium]|nr:long-chain acyl-CoA synthetase [Solirubrobacteraceae bacterium]